MKQGTIAAYVRVSTKDQDTGAQRAEIEKWLNVHGLESAIWYEDQESGATMQRPSFQRLQADIFAGKVKTVIVWKLDRLSRNMRDGINILADWTERGLRVVVVTQQIDLAGTIGRVIAAVLLGFAEIEREYIRERQKAGIARAKARGAYKGSQLGRSKADKARARQLRDKGFNVDEVAAALRISRRTAFRYLA
jgi:DNA invertase Pin-like site-specific DNA recombinase